MKTRIHVNQHHIKRNRQSKLLGAFGDAMKPVLTVKTYKDNRLGNEAVILDRQGEEVARVIYRPDKPLSCGAHVWIETELEVIVK